MKIKDINKLKGINEVTVELSSDELKRYLNRARLSMDAGLRFDSNIPFDSNVEKLLYDELTRMAILESFGKVKDVAKESIEDEEDFMFVSNEVIPLQPSGSELLVKVYTNPGIKFDYKNLPDVEPYSELSEEEVSKMVQTELESLQRKNARLIPYEGPLEKGKAANLIYLNPDGSEDLKKGNEVLFIDEIKNPVNLLNKKEGDVVIFPKDNEILNVKIDKVYDIDVDDIDDEFASEVSEFETLDELKQSIIDHKNKSQKEDYLRDTKEKLASSFIEGIELDDADESILDMVNSFDMSEYLPSWFVAGLISRENRPGSPQEEYYLNLLKYVFNQVIEEEKVNIEDEVEQVLNDVAANKENEKYINYLRSISYNNPDISQENLEKMVRDSVIAENAFNIILNNSLDSENK